MNDPEQCSEKTILDRIGYKMLGPLAERYGDVMITTSDKVRIPASRMLLAAQSDYFDKLFFSDFKESMSDEIKLDMPSDVVRSLLQYIFTGRSILDKFNDLLKHKFQNANNFDFLKQNYESAKLVHPVCRKEDIYEAVKLGRAADFILCSQLFDLIGKTLVSMAIEFPYLMCTVFEALWGENALLDKPPCDQCVEGIRRAPRFAFLVVPQYKYLTSIQEYRTETLEIRRLANAGFGVSCLSFGALKKMFHYLAALGSKDTECLCELVLYWRSKGGEVDDLYKVGNIMNRLME